MKRRAKIRILLRLLKQAVTEEAVSNLEKRYTSDKTVLDAVTRKLIMEAYERGDEVRNLIRLSSQITAPHAIWFIQDINTWVVKPMRYDEEFQRELVGSKAGSDDDVGNEAPADDSDENDSEALADDIDDDQTSRPASASKGKRKANYVESEDEYVEGSSAGNEGGSFHRESARQSAKKICK